jgi:siroheme synthase
LRKSLQAEYAKQAAAVEYRVLEFADEVAEKQARKNTTNAPGIVVVGQQKHDVRARCGSGRRRESRDDADRKQPAT